MRKRINKNNVISTLVFSHNRVSLLVCVESTRRRYVAFFRAYSKRAPSRSFCDPGQSTLPAVRSKSTFSTDRALLPLSLARAIYSIYYNVPRARNRSFVSCSESNSNCKNSTFSGKKKHRSPVVPELFSSIPCTCYIGVTNGLCEHSRACREQK